MKKRKERNVKGKEIKRERERDGNFLLIENKWKKIRKKRGKL